MKCSLALFIHAFVPDVFKDYASRELNSLTNDSNDSDDHDTLTYNADHGQLAQDLELLKKVRSRT